MSRLHLRFRNFHADTLAAAQTVFDAKPWALEDDEDGDFDVTDETPWRSADEKRAEVGQAFVDALAIQHGFPAARVEITGSRYHTGFQPAIVMESVTGVPESVESSRILLRSWSILSLFKNARVYLLAHGVEPTVNEEPFAWACSLFYAVRPIMFRARARENRVRGVTARDTYSRETWQRLTAEGLTDGDWLVTAERARQLGPTSLMDAEEIDDPYDDDNPTVGVALTDAAEGEAVELAITDNLPDEFETDEPTTVPVEQAEADAELANDLAVDPDGNDDGLNALGIVALRRLSRGTVSGGYSMSKPALVAALRSAGVRA